MDQTNQQDSSLASPATRAAAFSVHVFTALGAGIALIALLEAVREHWAAMFAWLGVALMVDAVDGPIARRLDVARVQPNWSGDVLDLVVDFVTYVFVPAYAITASGLLLPVAAPLTKIMATKNFGGEVVLYGDTFDEAVAHSRELQSEHGYTYVHAFDDELVERSDEVVEQRAALVVEPRRGNIRMPEPFLDFGNIGLMFQSIGCGRGAQRVHAHSGRPRSQPSRRMVRRFGYGRSNRRGECLRLGWGEITLSGVPVRGQRFRDSHGSAVGRSAQPGDTGFSSVCRGP